MRQALSGKMSVLAGVLCVLLVAAHYSGWLRPAENAAQALVVAPFTRLHAFSVATGTSYEFFTNQNDFINRYRQCVLAAGDAAALSARDQLLRDENDELKKQLHFNQTAHTRQVGAEVMGNALDATGERTVIIDQGGTAGLALGQAVVVGQGILIGKITKVNDTIAFVRLLTDNQSKVGARVLNADRSIGVVEGGYGISLRMSFIPRNEALQVGDQVVTSGLENGLPAGLLIGTVAVVENESYQPFQQAVVTPAVDATKVTVVSVLLNGSDNH